MDLGSVAAGFIAYGLAVLTGALLVFGTYRFNTILSLGVDEERLLRSGHRSVAISLGAIILCQALLLRHAVSPTMVVVRELFLHPSSAKETASALIHCLLFFSVVSLLAVGSVAVASWLFARLTRALPEREAILEDNVAVAIFFAFVLLAITAIVNEGLEDLSRSLIPYARSGIIRIP